MGDDNLDVIGILRTHLDEIYAVLCNSRTREEAADLMDALRNGRKVVKPSWMARELNRAIEHVEGYLSVTLDEDVSTE